MLISKSYVLDSELHLIMLSQLVFLYNKTEFYLYALALMQSIRPSNHRFHTKNAWYMA